PRARATVHGAKLTPVYAGRPQAGALVGVTALELNRDHLEKVFGYCEIAMFGDHVDHRVSVRVRRLAAPDQLLDDGDDEERVAIGAVGNERGKTIDRVGEAALKDSRTFAVERYWSATSTVRPRRSTSL